MDTVDLHNRHFEPNIFSTLTFVYLWPHFIRIISRFLQKLTQRTGKIGDSNKDSNWLGVVNCHFDEKLLVTNVFEKLS